MKEKKKGVDLSNITDNQELMNIFFDETQSLINEIRKELSVLEKDQKISSTIYRRLFRYAHIITSSSYTVGFDSLAEMAKALEKFFRAAEEENIEIHSGIISLLLECNEVCQKLLKKEEVHEYRKLLEQLNDLLSLKNGEKNGE